MSSKLKNLFLVTAVTFSITAQASWSSLNEAPLMVNNLMNQLENKSLSDQQRLQMVREKRTFLTNLLDSALDDLSVPYSELSPVFQAKDQLTVLNKLKIDDTGRFSEESCGHAKARAIMQDSMGSLESPPTFENRLLSLIEKICRK